MKPRVAAVAGSLLLFLLGLAGVWRLARREDAGLKTPVVHSRPATVDSTPAPGAPRASSVPVVNPAPPPDQIVSPVTQQRPMVQAPAPTLTASVPAPAIGSVSAEDLAAARIEVDQVSLMFRDYRTRMGDNPVGTNAEIMQAVMGGNPKGARLGPPEGQRLNGKGELVDRWGTAYFFHQMSATHMEIHSAGPDKVFGTEDDIVQK